MRPPTTPRERSAPEPASGPESPDAPDRDAPTPSDAPNRTVPTPQEAATPSDAPEAREAREAREKRTSREPVAPPPREPADATQPEPADATPRGPADATPSDPATTPSQESPPAPSQEASARPARSTPARPARSTPVRAHRPPAQEPTGSAAAPPVTDLADLAPAAWPARAAAAWPAVPLITALALWTYAIRHTDVSALDDFGLLSALHLTFWAGLGVLTAGFWSTVRDPRRRDGWSLAYVLGLLVMERATQAVLYPAPLYAWAWKHDAVIDHLLTSGGLQTADQLGDMAVYDQWPGFFAAQAALVRLLGVDNAAMYMAWWPLVSSVMLLLPLLLIYRTFTADRRLIWTAVWLFCVGNWVGQDYFSPQSVAFALHLGVIAVVLRRFGGRRGRSGQAVWTVLLSVLVTAVVVSHQLTPGMLVVTLVALAFTRRHRHWVPVITTVVLFLAWCLTAALPFLSAAMPDMIRSIGDVGANVETGYGATPTGTGAVATSWAARLLSGSVLLLALAGVLRQRVLRRRALPLLLVAAAPLPMFVASSYGSEMIFRVLLFMLPGAAFFAAAALLPKVRTLAGDAAAREAGGHARVAPARRRRLPLPSLPPLRYAAWAPLLALLAGTFAFVPSYSGKDRINYFPPAEVALVRQLFDRAPDDSLVVAANRNYPLAYEQYWRVDHYWFLDDDRRHVDEIVRDPATVLARDMAAVEAPARAYFLLTQGQVANSEMNGQLDETQLRRVRESVATSSRFELLAENGAGALYALRPAS
ncbi:glycosyltransferase [Streptomyces sp. NPDC016675]|uniref:glycosyltransferase n=1 Tax=Streptomyces sp. NPDC016675 TaxID=3364970 RepID=UPI0036FBA03A